jgi:imidazolonepropionase-like amidohydrolase
MKKTPVYTAAIALAGSLLSATPLMAQHRSVPPPAAYAIEGVTVVGPGLQEEPGVTVIVRGGLIEAMGAGVAIPADAERLEGDSLFLYPGLVDGDGVGEFEFPEAPEDGPPSWAPTRVAQRVTPHRRVADHITATGGAQGEQRRRGIVAAAVHAGDGIAPGRSAVLLNRVDAETSRELIARPDAGLSMALQTAPGVYPVTLLGVMATIRQAFLDAERQATLERAFASGSAGLTMPDWDPDYEVLRDVAAGGTPVFFRAADSEDIRRVLGLADEVGLRPIIVGGDEAWQLADELADRSVPVLVDTDFPEPEEWDPESEEELEPAAFREKRELEAVYANAAALEAAGVQFALTSGEGDADPVEGARKAVEYGLSRNAAIAALTTAPAGILGVESLIRVDEGRPATFILTTGPLLDEGSEIAYTFVEGRYEVGPGSGAGGGEAPTVNVTGSWEVEVTAQGMTVPMEMELQQEGGEFSGTAAADMFGDAEVRGGRVSGSEVSFRLVVAAGGQSMELSFEADVEGDRMNGSGSSPMGDFQMTARRAPGGAR